MTAAPDPSLKAGFSTCKICGADGHVFRTAMYDDRYGYPGRFDLYRCRHCGHIQVGAYFDEAELQALYTNYYPRSSFSVEKHSVPLDATGFRAWFDGLRSAAFRWIPTEVRILDIGCGFGEALGYHAARRCDVQGVEADENARRVAERYGYRVHIGLFDPELYEANYFDYVTLDQVIEHAVQPVNMLKGVARVLKPGGVAILTTPNPEGWGARLFGRRWINWHVPYHLHQFSRRSMALAARQAGLTMYRSLTVTNSEWLLYQWLHILTYPPQGHASSFWKPADNGQTPWRLARRLVLAAHRMKVDHVLTRLFDMSSLGDNRVFFVRKGEQNRSELKR